MSQRMKQRGKPRRSAEKGGTRGARLEELIREEINFVLQSEVSDERLDGVTVTQVELARDGSRARLWFAPSTSVPSDEDEVERTLARAAGFLRARLCESLFFKRVPELRFRCDPAANVREI